MYPEPNQYNDPLISSLHGIR